MSEQCLLIAGEKSGEEHALSFVSELKRLKPDLHFFGVGGDELASKGMELCYHLKDFSSFGFSEVVSKIPFYFKALKHLENEVKKRKCKVAILIDFQDFNLRLAKRLKKNGVKVLYYVAPQAWAWKAGRAQALEQTVHTLFSILPFEKKWFSDRGVKKIVSVPHPLSLRYKDEVAKVGEKPHELLHQSLKLLILPGSRNDEVRYLMPAFEQTIANLRRVIKTPIEVAMVRSSNVKTELWEMYSCGIDLVWNNEDLDKALSWAHLSLAASGTVTLATGLFQVPTVVCYQGSLLNQYIFETFVRYDKPISLTNLILETQVFPEFIQERASAFNMTSALLNLFNDKQEYDRVKMELSKLPGLLAGESEPAQLMLKAFEEKNEAFT
tara:strand:- start:1290 stop:2435 length:1146 start_codon:yes stop_codon:yes gene_type:complete